MSFIFFSRSFNSFSDNPPFSIYPKNINILSKIAIFLSTSFTSFSAFSNKNFNSYNDTSLFILALFLIYLALLPNFNVDIVSASLNIDGLHVMIKHVLELPPSDSLNILVNLESL
jgi:hypothetical protein